MALNFNGLFAQREVRESTIPGGRGAFLQPGDEGKQSGAAGVLRHLAVKTDGTEVSTTSATMVMAGFALSFTPTKSGIIQVVAACQCNGSVFSDSLGIEIKYGTGTAPSTSDADTGTTIGIRVDQAGMANEGLKGMHMFMGRVIGLIVGTKYWLDFAWQRTAGTGTVNLHAKMAQVNEEV